MYYFEDLFYEVFKYWQGYIFINKENLDQSIFKIHEAIDAKFEIENNEFKKELLKLMNWSISVVKGDHLKEMPGDVFNLNSISLKEMEGRFKHDISIPEWSEYRSKYKGFKGI